MDSSSLILLDCKAPERPSKNCVKKIRNEEVKKNLRVVAGLNFLVAVHDF